MENAVTIITSLLQTGGIFVFLYFLIRGLRQQIKAMSKTLEEQNKTLDVMERRIEETQKVGDVYRQWLSDLPEDIEKYKTVVSKLKDETIEELQKAKEAQDKKLESMKELKLQELELQERALAELPDLHNELLETVEAIQQRFVTMARYARSVIPPQFQGASFYAVGEAHTSFREIRFPPDSFGVSGILQEVPRYTVAIPFESDEETEKEEDQSEESQ